MDEEFCIKNIKNELGYMKELLTLLGFKVCFEETSTEKNIFKKLSWSVTKASLGYLANRTAYFNSQCFIPSTTPMRVTDILL